MASDSYINNINEQNICKKIDKIGYKIALCVYDRLFSVYSFGEKLDCTYIFIQKRFFDKKNINQVLNAKKR